MCSLIQFLQATLRELKVLSKRPSGVVAMITGANRYVLHTMRALTQLQLQLRAVELASIWLKSWLLQVWRSSSAAGAKHEVQKL
jgi:hypothetical protein